jgi:hypothetical protein
MNEYIQRQHQEKEQEQQRAGVVTGSSSRSCVIYCQYVFSVLHCIIYSGIYNNKILAVNQRFQYISHISSLEIMFLT